MDRFTRLGEQMLGLARAGEPCVCRASVPLTTEAEAFEWLQQAAVLHRALRESNVRKKLDSLTRRLPSSTDASDRGGRRPVFFAYVGQYSDLWPRVPLRSDRDFRAYIARLRGELAGEEFGFQVPQLESAGDAAFLRFRAVVAPFIEALGPLTMRFNAFYGDYRRTPFGIHGDAHHLHAFQYIIHGTKTLRTWDSIALREAIGEAAFATLLDNPNEYAGPLPGERTLIAEPGDLLYWPGHYTHCLESAGPNFGLGVIVESKGGTLADSLKTRLSTRADEAAQRAPAAMRSDWAGDVEGLREMLAELSGEIASGALERDLILDGLAMRTGQGSVGTSPLARDVAIEATTIVDSLVPAGASIASTVYQDALQIAANGHSAGWSIPDATAPVRDLMTCLQTVNGASFSEIVRRFSPPIDESTIAKLVQFLASTHAVRLRRIGNAEPEACREVESAVR